MLYSGNRFTFQSTHALITFSRSIVPERLQEIKSITLRELLAVTFNGNLVFQFSHPKKYPPDDLLVVLSLMRGLRHLALRYVLDNENYKWSMNQGYFPFPQTFPTAFLHPCCTVEHETEALSDLVEHGFTNNVGDGRIFMPSAYQI